MVRYWCVVRALKIRIVRCACAAQILVRAHHYCLLLSDNDDSDREYVKPIIVPKIEVPETLHQIINYPALEKHSTMKIIDICNEINLIDQRLQRY